MERQRGVKAGQVLVAKASDTLKAIVAELVKRADAIRNRTVKPEEDNMLPITNDGRRAALDVRMMDPSLPADPEGKLAKAAANIYQTVPLPNLDT